MADPRISRTETYVYECVGGMLASTDVSNLSIAGIAVHCSVARRTLYAHWGSLSQLLRGTFAHFYQRMSDIALPRDSEARFEMAMLHIRTALESPVTRAALLAPDETGEARRSILELWREEMSELVQPLTTEEFSRLIGPMCAEMLVFGQTTELATIRRSISDATRKMDGPEVL